MKLIIDISEEDYRRGTVMASAIINGTPPIDTANYPSNYVRLAKAIIEADKAEREKKHENNSIT